MQASMLATDFIIGNGNNKIAYFHRLLRHVMHWVCFCDACLMFFGIHRDLLALNIDAVNDVLNYNWFIT